MRSPYPSVPIHAPRKERSFAARSVLASALTALDPPELSVSELIRLAAIFNITANNGRVALSRMVAAGEVTTDGLGNYRLTGQLLDRQRELLLSGIDATREWKGDWCIAIVSKSRIPAEVRNQRRRAFASARLAPLREGVWLRPNNLEMELSEEVDPDVLCCLARMPDDNVLARQLWPLAAWSDRAKQLLTRLDERRPLDLSHLATGIEIGSIVARHLVGDPLLPLELLPEDWPGDLLRSRLSQHYELCSGLIVSWVESGTDVEKPLKSTRSVKPQRRHQEGP